MGAVSYLMIQGPFGSGGSTQTLKWQVNYNAGTLVTGYDLLKAVFGTPVAAGTYDDAFFTTYNYFTSGNSTQGAGFIDFGGGSYFTESFTLGGTKVAQTTDYATGWNYYAAGGSYANGTWAYSNDGITTRTLTDGSFDGWVYGNTYPSATITGSGTAPLASNFTSATVINLSAAPEPGRVALCGVALAALALRRLRAGR